MTCYKDCVFLLLGKEDCYKGIEWMNNLRNDEQRRKVLDKKAQNLAELRQAISDVIAPFKGELMSKYIIIYRWRTEQSERGLHLSSLVHYALRDRNCQTWVDHLSLKSGQLLVNAIQQTMQDIGSVIIVLAPGDLDRCTMEDDFFRFELDTAMDNQYKLHFLLFDVSNIEELFPRRKTPFLLKLFNKMLTVACKFVSMDGNFESVINELANYT
jgi:hypothetical protein